MKRSSWTMIRDALSNDIAIGKLSPGDRLPTETELAERFKAGRHSVRRAVESLAKIGKVSIEQGRGTFIEAAPLLNYTIGKRTRLRRNLLPQGCEVSGDLMGACQIEAPESVRNALGLETGSKVVESRRITLADGIPIAFGAKFHDAVRFGDVVERRDLLGSMTEVYKSYGIKDYVRSETSMYARPAKADEAHTLRQHKDMPVIVVKSLDTELNGTPLSFSQVVWSAARVKFTVATENDE